MTDVEKPDPSEVESIDTSKYVYERDEHGDLIPETDVVEVDGEWRRVEHLPPAKGFLVRLEKKFEGREEIGLGEIDDLMADWYVDPDPDDWGDTDPALYIPLMKHLIITLGGNLDDDLTEQIKEEIEERQDEGN